MLGLVGGLKMESRTGPSFTRYDNRDQPRAHAIQDLDIDSGGADVLNKSLFASDGNADLIETGCASGVPEIRAAPGAAGGAELLPVDLNPSPATMASVPRVMGESWRTVWAMRPAKEKEAPIASWPSSRQEGFILSHGCLISLGYCAPKTLVFSADTIGRNPDGWEGARA